MRENAYVIVTMATTSINPGPSMHVHVGTFTVITHDHVPGKTTPTPMCNATSFGGKGPHLVYDWNNRFYQTIS